MPDSLELPLDVVRAIEKDLRYYIVGGYKKDETITALACKYTMLGDMFDEMERKLKNAK